MRLVSFLSSEILQVSQILQRARTARLRGEPDYFSVTHLHWFSVKYARILKGSRSHSEVRDSNVSKTKGGKKESQTFLVPLFPGQERFGGAPEQDLMLRMSRRMTGDLITSCNSSLAPVMFLPDVSFPLSALLLRNVENWALFSVRVLKQPSPSKSGSHWRVERSHPVYKFHFTPHPHTGGRVKQGSQMSLFFPLAFLNSHKNMQPITGGSHWLYG